jgi:hypothetical protein
VVEVIVTLIGGGGGLTASPHPDTTRASSRVFFISENAPDLRRPATYSGATSIYSSTTTQVNALKVLSKIKGLR